ncbi:MBL fold metallo-hydrolase [Pedobacter agri]|uniref:MBL fold metallo-hydrolase n=1 Tax=Pedobacter agri TaxID=454586 RepID=UPI002784F881|nr:MBL fold metallo-hydrolase [Pedobacter agri]MDQ1139810.1 hydroxyacylglutathione hydrolase [Pedobacter agri]
MRRRSFIRQAGGFFLLSAAWPSEVFSGSRNWHIEQFQDKGLAHFSYAVLVNGKIILIDPARNPKPYLDYAKSQNAAVTGVIETHPHADFTSSHLEFQKLNNIKIYASSLTKAGYQRTGFDDGSKIKLSDSVSLRSVFTPGHAPDHIAVVLTENGKDIAVFSGDSLLIGDVGRPDLREIGTDATTQRKRLAEQLFDTLHQKFAKLADSVIVYPAHGAGSLCGKAIRDAASSTIGDEKAHNPAFQIKTKEEFVKNILNDLPFTPKYFSYDVAWNIKGLPGFAASIASVKLLETNFVPSENSIIVDARPESVFKKSYLKNAINLQNGTKFETWLGSTISPNTSFYLIAGDKHALEEVIAKTAKIGYEQHITGAFIYNLLDGQKLEKYETTTSAIDESTYTIIDVRTEREFRDEPIFKSAINIPLQDLKDQLNKIPQDKPILVNCASGYRSAAGSSMIKNKFPNHAVYDLGTAVLDLEKIGTSHKPNH